jgi:predicted nucleic acid-binding protein
MTVLVDTGVLYADHDTDASRHETASAALETVYDGALGQPYVSDYIYDEAVTLTLMRGGEFEPAKQLGERLRGGGSYPEVFERLRVSESVFTAAIETFEQYADQQLSFTDATSVALVEYHDIEHVLSFDDDFDGVVARVDPDEIDGAGRT